MTRLMLFLNLATGAAVIWPGLFQMDFARGWIGIPAPAEVLSLSLAWYVEVAGTGGEIAFYAWSGVYLLTALYLILFLVRVDPL